MAKVVTECGEYELLFERTSIGSGRLNEIRIDDPAEPPLHCTIVAKGQNRYELQNHSPHGTLLNGRPVRDSAELKDGDVLWVGTTRLVFEAGEEVQTPPPKRPGLVVSVIRLVFGTFLSRALGLVREMTIGHFLGLGGGTDALFVAFSIPNLFRRVMGEKAMESAFMPTFQTYITKGKAKEGWWVAGMVFWVVSGILLVLASITAVLAPWLIDMFAPGFDAETHGIAVRLTWVMLPFMLFIGLSALVGSILLSFRRFIVYSSAPICFSVSVIGCVGLLHGRLGVYSAGVGIVLGGFLQFAAQVVALGGRWKCLFQRAISVAHPAMKRIFALSIPIAISSALERVGTIVDRALASLLVSGSVSALYYSFRLVQLPFAIIGLAIGRAVYPSLVEESSLENRGKFLTALNQGIRLNLILVIPISVVTILLSGWLVRLIYEHGAFGGEATRMTSIAVVCYAFGLLGMSLTATFNRAFYARLDTRTPLKVSGFGVLLNIVLDIILMQTWLKHAGLALATSVSFSAQAMVLYWLLRKRLSA